MTKGIRTRSFDHFDVLTVASGKRFPAFRVFNDEVPGLRRFRRR